MSRRFHRYQQPADPIPWVSYLVGVGSALGCLLCATSLYLPKQDRRPFPDIDGAVTRVQVARTVPVLPGTRDHLGNSSPAAQTFASGNPATGRR